MKPLSLIIAFAGVPGSSKTPIANYLSYSLNLPLFNTDAIRRETVEDLEGKDWIAEFDRRCEERLNHIIASGLSFIYDASVDRRWPVMRQALEQHGYVWYVISMDFSREFLEKLYAIKDFRQPLDLTLTDHKQFLQHYSGDVALSITDDLFAQRLAISLAHTQAWKEKQAR